MLKKSYYLENQPDEDELMFDHAEGTTIEWKANKNLTERIETKKQRHKASQKVRVVKRTVPQESFFNFFTPPQLPEEDDDEEEEMEIDLEELQQRLQEDYAIGEHFKDEIIPHAIKWFTGEAVANDDVSAQFNN